VFQVAALPDRELVAGPVVGGDRARYKTGYTDQDGVKQGSRTTGFHDLSASYAATKDMLLTVGINNVFDKDPPLSVRTRRSSGATTRAFTDPIGRSFLLRASYKFF
jgi:iron complex outermembrane receptor protein